MRSPRTTSRSSSSSALKGVFTDVVEEQVTFVNAPLLAEERGLQVRLTSTEESDDYRNLITVRGSTRRPASSSRSRGTLSGRKQVAKLVEVNGFDVDVALSEHMAFFRYHDEPGIVGKLGNCSARAASTSPDARSPARPPAATR